MRDAPIVFTIMRREETIVDSVSDLFKRTRHSLAESFLVKKLVDELYA